MAKKDRTGNRKTRNQRKQSKVPELGYYLIVTDTEATERCFFTGLHQALPEDVRNKLVIKVVETKTRTIIDKCLELTAYDAQYRIPWIVFDRDQVKTPGLVVRILDEYMKPRLDRNTPRLMSRCMEKSAKLVKKKKQFR